MLRYFPFTMTRIFDSSTMTDAPKTEGDDFAMTMSLAVPLGVAVAYLSTSLLFLRFPTVLHKKKKVNFTVSYLPGSIVGVFIFANMIIR